MKYGVVEVDRSAQEKTLERIWRWSSAELAEVVAKHDEERSVRALPRAWRQERRADEDSERTRVASG